MPVDTPQGRVIVLRDPFGFTPAMLQVSQHTFFIVSLLDGTRGLEEIQALFMHQFGSMVEQEHIDELLLQLDDCCFLDNEKFAELRDGIIDQFLKSPIRMAAHSGSAYPEMPDALAGELEKMFTAGNEGREINWDSTDNTARALIVPHIDFDRGAEAYVKGYTELAQSCQAETFVVLGTAHTGMERPFCLTLKDFDTPLGQIDNDREFSKELLDKCPWLKDDEFEHRGEHSIEFQAVFLQYLFGRRRITRIVPVLCGSFHKGDGEHSDPANDRQVSEFIDALSEALQKRGGSVCVIASADMSHVGTRFGDQVPINDQLLKYIEERDLKSLEFAARADAPGFYADVTADGDRRKICGLPNIYALLRIFEGTSGRLIKYVQSPDKATGSVVTFASMILE